MRKAFALVLLGLLLISSPVSAGILEDFLGWLQGTGEAFGIFRPSMGLNNLTMSATIKGIGDMGGSKVTCLFIDPAKGGIYPAPDATVKQNNYVDTAVCTMTTLTSGVSIQYLFKNGVKLVVRTTGNDPVMVASQAFSADDLEKRLVRRRKVGKIEVSLPGTFLGADKTVCCRQPSGAFLSQALFKCIDSGLPSRGTVVSDKFCDPSSRYCETESDCKRFDLCSGGTWACQANECAASCPTAVPPAPSTPPQPEYKELASIGKGPSDGIGYVTYQAANDVEHKIPFYIPNLVADTQGRVFTFDQGAKSYWYTADPATLQVEIREGTSETGSLLSQQTIPAPGSFSEPIALYGLDNVKYEYYATLGPKGFALVLGNNTFDLRDNSRLVFQGADYTGDASPTAELHGIDLSFYIQANDEFPLNGGPWGSKNVTNVFTFSTNHAGEDTDIYIDGSTDRLPKACQATYYGAYKSTVCLAIYDALSVPYYDNIITATGNYKLEVDGRQFKVYGKTG